MKKKILTLMLSYKLCLLYKLMFPNIVGKKKKKSN